MNAGMKGFVLICLGGIAGASAMWLFESNKTVALKEAEPVRKPIYWVAPMDPGYRRDQPGKSPMGMDLVPVYADDGEKEQPGTVMISPDVINNLGVRSEQVSKGKLALSIDTVGYVQYDEDYLVHIHPRVEGWIEQLYVKAAGDPVKAGQALYALYSPTLVNAQDEFLLALKRNNPALIKAATARLEALQVPSAAIRKLRDSEKVSQTITVRAPQSGVLDNLTVREGMYVKPGMEMMMISQLEHIWVIGEVFERQAMRIQKGDPVQIRLDFLPGREWGGQVDYVYPSLNTQTRTERVRVHLDNPDGYLKPGMFARMTIETRSGLPTLLISREALIRTGSQSRVVLALGKGRYKSIEVKVGRINENKVEILDGLVEGDSVVTSAQFLLDSESSKTSDFRRMNHDADEGNSLVSSDSVWATARVTNVMAEKHMVTLAHDPIKAWQWPAMTMDFRVSSRLDLDELKAGMTVHVKIVREKDRMPEITVIHYPDASASQGNIDTKHENTRAVTEEAPGSHHDMPHAPHSEEGQP